MKESDEHSSL